tara:strand:+ start:123 stop:500 length:378 start_codon:yes stop_codon:yes gene_type:complete
MLLSLSSAAIGTEPDITSINGTTGTEAIPAAEELVKFTESVHRLDESLEIARENLIDSVGLGGMIDAAIISSVFRSLNITADSSGIRIDDDWEASAASLASDTGAYLYRTIENSPNVQNLVDMGG